MEKCFRRYISRVRLPRFEIHSPAEHIDIWIERWSVAHDITLSTLQYKHVLNETVRICRQQLFGIAYDANVAPVAMH